jgi:hypothetical protein
MGAQDVATRRHVQAVLYLHAGADLGDAAVVGRLLDALAGHAQFSPTQWGTDERIRLDYDHGEVLGRASGGGPIRQVLLYRKKAVKYEGHFEARKGSFVSFEFDDRFDAASWTDLLRLADQIAEVVRPRFAVAHRFMSSPSPWENEEQRAQQLVDAVAQPIPVRFNASGPLGLAMRTYFSGDVADLFGRDLLLSAPAVVDELDWGGIRIDLLDDMWDAPDAALVERWSAATAHLAPSEALAEATPLRSRRGFDFGPSPAWKRRQK